MSKVYVSNEKLKRARELRGWSQEEFARRVGCLADSLGHRGVVLDVSTISRWERGRNAPSPFYRQLLCLLFEMNAEELGLLPTENRAQAVERSRTLKVKGYREYSAPEMACNGYAVPDEPTCRDIYTFPEPERACQELPNAETPPGSSTVHAPFMRRRDFLLALLASASLGGGAAIVMKLFQAHPKPRASTPPVTPTLPPAPATPTSTPTTSTGLARNWPKVIPNSHQESARVRVIQWMLNAHGWHLQVDGVYWVDTENALMFFEESAHLSVTTTVSKTTWERLIIASSMDGKQATAKGSHVKALQEMLNIYGASPRLQVDGEFGPLTEAATRHFQQTHHLPVNGVADLDTWCLLVGGYLK